MERMMTRDERPLRKWNWGIIDRSKSKTFVRIDLFCKRKETSRVLPLNSEYRQ